MKETGQIARKPFADLVSSGRLLHRLRRIGCCCKRPVLLSEAILPKTRIPEDALGEWSPRNDPSDPSNRHRVGWNNITASYGF
eukprot:6274350-Amphidinium_carterae.1